MHAESFIRRVGWSVPSISEQPEIPARLIHQLLIQHPVSLFILSSLGDHDKNEFFSVFLGFSVFNDKLDVAGNVTNKMERNSVSEPLPGFGVRSARRALGGVDTGGDDDSDSLDTKF